MTDLVPLFSCTLSCCLRLTVLVVQGHARLRQFRRTADLGAGHVTFKDVPKFSSFFVPIGLGDVGPHVREHGIP